MGAFSSKPHTVESKWFDEFKTKLPSLKDKTVAITGTTSGTGFIAARTSIEQGAENVLLLNRPSERADKAEAELKKVALDNKTGTKVESIPCDLQDFDSVRKAAETITKKYKALDVLCNNAGVMALDDYATKDGYDVQMQTNHLSHFLLTKELFPLLKKARELRGEARVVNHTSLARKGKPLEEKYFGKNGGDLGGNGNSAFFGGAKWARYQQSKLANAVFTVALADRLKESGIKAVSAAPGLAATNLQTTTNESGGMSGMMWIMYFSQSAEDGTMPLLSACFDPSTKNGDLLEPSWRFNFVGPATKSKFEPVCVKEDSQTLLWEASEAACGKFVSD